MTLQDAIFVLQFLMHLETANNVTHPQTLGAGPVHLLSSSVTHALETVSSSCSSFATLSLSLASTAFIVSIALSKFCLGFNLLSDLQFGLFGLSFAFGVGHNFGIANLARRSHEVKRGG